MTFTSYHQISRWKTMNEYYTELLTHDFKNCFHPFLKALANTLSEKKSCLQVHVSVRTHHIVHLQVHVSVRTHHIVYLQVHVSVKTHHIVYLQVHVSVRIV